jgi:hypothetical protein
VSIFNDLPKKLVARRLQQLKMNIIGMKLERLDLDIAMLITYEQKQKDPRILELQERLLTIAREIEELPDELDWRLPNA